MKTFKSDLTDNEAELLHQMDQRGHKTGAIKDVILQLRDRKGSDIGMTMMSRARWALAQWSLKSGSERDHAANVMCITIADCFGEDELFWRAALDELSDMELLPFERNIIFNKEQF